MEKSLQIFQVSLSVLVCFTILPSSNGQLTCLNKAEEYGNKIQELISCTRKNSYSVSNFVNFRPLKSGYYGKVLVANHKLTGKAYAIKITDVNPFREVETVNNLNHGNVIKYESSWEEELADLKDAFNGLSNLYIIQMELCQGRDLAEWIEDLPFWMKSEEDAKKIVLQMVAGVEYIHKQGIVHRDLKPRNILLKYSYKMNQTDLIVKIVDFGSSAELFEISQPNSNTDLVGTPFYMSPEQGEMKSHDSSTDIYAMGLIMYEVLMSSLTDTLEETRAEDERNRKGIFPKEFVDKFEVENKLIKAMVAENPCRRPSATFILKKLKKLWPNVHF